MLCLWISWRFVEAERAPIEVKILIFRVLDGARTVSTLHLVPERSRSAELMVAIFCSLWFGRLTNQAQCNGAEVERKKGNVKLPFGSVAERSRSISRKAILKSPSVQNIDFRMVMVVK